MLPSEMVWLFEKIFTSGDMLGIFLKFVEATCATVIIFSVVIDFLEFDKRDDSVDGKKSIVTTLTMSLYFLVFVVVLYSHMGTIQLSSSLQMLTVLLGNLILIVGTFFNVKGRFNLGKQWGDQIVIYEGHRVVREGVYSIVRHPLYASLIWISIGLSFIYANWIAFLLNLVVFVPFMSFRAKQEEVLLGKHFVEYNLYKKEVGMFLPSMSSLKVYFAKSKLEEIDLNALLFCKWVSAILIWLAVILGNYFILIAVALNFLLSVLFTVKNSPIVLVYRFTLGLLIKNRTNTIDVQDYRFVHLIAFIFSFIAIVPLLFGNTIWLLIPAILFAILKTITAFGYCPASKLRSCLLNQKGSCCKLGQKCNA
jgi:protein-S-isoprenylcysteine O-methyltransferase Ste14